MLDNELIILVKSVIAAGFSVRSMPMNIVQKNQPTQQGVNIPRTVYIEKLFDHPYGFPLNKSEWDIDAQLMRTTQSQWYETTFQISALSIQDPSNTGQATASDIANIARQIVQTDPGVRTLQDSQIGVLRVTQVRNPYFGDDRGRFEANPSFDFTVTHEQVIISTTPVVVTEEFHIARV